MKSETKAPGNNGTLENAVIQFLSFRLPSGTLLFPVDVNALSDISALHFSVDFTAFAAHREECAAMIVDLTVDSFLVCTIFTCSSIATKTHAYSHGMSCERPHASGLLSINFRHHRMAESNERKETSSNTGSVVKDIAFY